MEATDSGNARPAAPRRPVRIGGAAFGGGPLALIAGPCQIESRDHALSMAERLVEIASRRGIPYVYKSSYDKANRTSVDGARGLGMEEGLAALAEVRERFGCPVISDVHLPDQCAPAAEALDALQIPALLSRQTDLLVAAGRSGRPVMVKKGQFMAPPDMAHAVGKVLSAGNRDVLVCERGSSFGYRALVADMAGLPTLAATGCPVVFDATHAAQAPAAAGGASGGNRESVPVLARAAVAAGVDGVFIEVHDDPDHALSDGPVMLPLDGLERLIETLQAIHEAAGERP